jgi:uncharacterized protein (DUF1697 family)
VALYVALLRGINVGGKNLIRMPALKECFETAGFEDVSTYIQSGNVLFRAAGAASALPARVEKTLSKTFDYYQASVVIRSHAQLRSTVESAPVGFGVDPEAYRYDVLFLKPPLTASKALEQVPVKDGVDDVHAGRGVLYFSRLASRASSSRLSRVASMPIYKSMTIRNWNTTTRLLQLMDEA